MVRRTILVVAALAALLMSGTAMAAPEKEFKARLEGTAAVATLSNGTKSLTIQGEGQATSGIGKVEFTGGFDFRGALGRGCVQFTGGSLILTNRKGDQLVLHPVAGQACASGNGQSLTVALTIVIGTGRFEGATGRATLTGTLTPQAGGGYAFRGDLTGSLTR